MQTANADVNVSVKYSGAYHLSHLIGSSLDPYFYRFWLNKLTALHTRTKLRDATAEAKYPETQTIPRQFTLLHFFRFEMLQYSGRLCLLALTYLFGTLMYWNSGSKNVLFKWRFQQLLINPNSFSM